LRKKRFVPILKTLARAASGRLLPAPRTDFEDALTRRV
jgi:hypothetical protein